MACFFKHSWNGCKCDKCGAVRDEGHDFLETDIPTVYQCTKCNQENCRIDTLAAGDIAALRRMITLPQMQPLETQANTAKPFGAAKKHLMAEPPRLCMNDIGLISAVYPIARDAYTQTRDTAAHCDLIDAVNKLTYYINNLAGHPEKTVYLEYPADSGRKREAAPAKPAMQGWIFSCYDHDRVQSLSVFGNGQQYYAKENIVKMVRDFMKLPEGAVELSYIPAPDWDAPNVPVEGNTFSCDIDVIYSKAVRFLIDRKLCDKTQAIASIKNNMPYPNAGLLLAVLLIAP